MSRKSLSKKTRFDVFKRDNFACQYCGSTPPSVVLEVDHITPVADGGDNSIDNLVCSCFDCNRGKGARSLDAVPETLKEKADRIKESEAQIAAYREAIFAKQDRITEDAWEVVAVFDDEADSFDKRKFTSIQMFLRRLPLGEVIEAAELAVERKGANALHTQFKYFCGVCWNKIKRQEEGFEG